MIRQADAVIGEAVLREVVGANLFAAIAGADLRLALRSLCGVLLLHLNFVESRAQNAHCLLAILDLRLFVLATDDGVGGKMRDAHSGVRGVDALSAGAGAAEGI